MADKRMFAKSIVLSDIFLDMPMSSRCLYFTLGMLADDDGFIGNVKSIMRQCGATVDDLNILLTKRYLLGFDNGVIVIKHWRINNYLRSDRHKETTYLEEKNQLIIDKNGAYTDHKKTLGVPSIDKSSKDESSKDKSRGFTPPTLEEVTSYCKERNNNVDAERFIDFYSSKGWFVGKNKMKDWKACVRTWEKREPKKEKEEISYSPTNNQKLDQNKLNDILERRGK